MRATFRNLFGQSASSRFQGGFESTVVDEVGNDDALGGQKRPSFGRRSEKDFATFHVVRTAFIQIVHDHIKGCIKVFQQAVPSIVGLRCSPPGPCDERPHQPADRRFLSRPFPSGAKDASSAGAQCFRPPPTSATVALYGKGEARRRRQSVPRVPRKQPIRMVGGKPPLSRPYPPDVRVERF